MIPGIDVSAHNGTPGTAGLGFGVVRATYAAVPDPKYRAHVTAFRRAGLPVGAYHFGVGWLPVSAQARVFLAVSADADWLVLDLESDGPHRKAMTVAQAAEFIRIVKAAAKGRKVGLYHSRSGFPVLGQDFNWVAHYGIPGAREGRNALRGIAWTFWQWQGSPLDRNWFNGDQAALQRFVGKSVPVPPPVPASKITALRGYVRALAAVRRPARDQVAKLAAYRRRLAEYLRRGR